MRTQHHRQPGRVLWLVLPLVVACGSVRKLASDPRLSMLGDVASGEAQAALNRATGGVLNPDALNLMRTLSPLATKAVNSIRDAIARHQVEKRSREAHDEENRRLRTAITQLFYRGECNRSTSGPRTAGTGRDDTASLESQANEAFGRGDYAVAEQLLKRVHDQREKQLGDRHPDTVRAFNKMIACQLALGNLQSAGVFAASALDHLENDLKAIKPATSPEPAEIAVALVAADTSSAMGLATRASGAYAAAKQDYERALELRTRSLSADHLCIAEAQNDLGELLLLMGDFPRAGALFEKALAIRERTPGQYRATAQSYNNLASYYRSIGDYEKAEYDYKRALAIRQAKLGKNDPEVAESLNDLGDLYKLSGSYSEAEAAYNHALEIRESRQSDSLATAQSLSALGGLYQKVGEYGRAQEFYMTALAMRQNVLCPGDRRHSADSLPAGRKPESCNYGDIAESLAALGSLHFALGDYARAGLEYQDALDIRKKTFGADHLLFAESLVELGSVNLALGDYARAESEYKAALDIQTKRLGAEHREVAQSLYRLGELYQVKGNDEKARAFCQRALDMRRKTLDKNHPEIAGSLMQLAMLKAVAGQVQDALKDLREAFDISEELLHTVGAASADSRMDALLHTLRAQEEIAYSLACSGCSASSPALDTASLTEVAQLAMSIALRRKGRSVDGAASLSRAIYQGLDDAGRQKYDDLRALRAQIASLTLGSSDDDAAAVECLDTGPARPIGPPQGRPDSGRAAKLKCLQEKAAGLEQELARLFAPLRARTEFRSSGGIVRSVARALVHPDEALIEITAFRPYVFSVNAKALRRGEPRYLALVLHGNASVHIVDLGPGQAIDTAVAEFRKQVGRAPELFPATDTPEDSYEMLKSAEQLYQLVFRPVRSYIDHDKSVFISPDGQLHLVPFAALFDGKQYLADTYQFTYLTSGRDLLRKDEGHPSTNVEVIANPDFIQRTPGAPSALSEGVRRNLVDDDGAPPKGMATPQGIPVDGALTFRNGIPPLKATAQEASEIRRVLHQSKVEVIQGSKATRQAFLELKSPGILHVATHGYFRNGRKGTDASGKSRGIEMAGGSTDVEDPLLNSMLILAGAGTAVEGPDGHMEVVGRPEGLVTARDVADMNLWGTQLVVLSACDTGLGDVSNLGQGVYGLRRAVMVGGAETLVTSLWQVNDRVTSDLMIHYYQNLLAGQGRVEAMRKSAEWVRKRHKHPHYWAPFIVIGSSGPLVGIGRSHAAALSPK